MFLKTIKTVLLLLIASSTYSQEGNINWDKARKCVEKHQYAEALPFLKSANEDFRNNEESFYQAKIWGEYLNIFEQLGEADSLEHYKNMHHSMLESDKMGNRAKGFINQRIGLMDYIENGNYEKSKEYFLKAFDFFQREPEKSKNEVLSCLYDYIIINQKSNNYIIADSLIIEGKQLAVAQKDVENIIKMSYIEIRGNGNRGQIEKGLRNWNSLQVKVKNWGESNLTKAQKNILLNSDLQYAGFMGNMHEQINVLHKLIDGHVQEGGKKISVVNHYATLCRLYVILQNFEQSVFYGELVFSIFEEADNFIPYVALYAYPSLVDAYVFLEEYDKAKQLLIESIEFAQTNDEYAQYSFLLHMRMGELNLDRGENEKSEKDFLKAATAATVAFGGGMAKHMTTLAAYVGIIKAATESDNYEKTMKYINLGAEEVKAAQAIDNITIFQWFYYPNYLLARANAHAHFDNDEIAFNSFSELEDSLKNTAGQVILNGILFRNHLDFSSYLQEKQHKSTQANISDLELALTKIKEAIQLEKDQLSKQPISLQNIKANSMNVQSQKNVFVSAASISYDLWKEQTTTAGLNEIFRFAEEGKAINLTQNNHADLVKLPSSIRNKEKELYALINFHESRIGDNDDFTSELNDAKKNLLDFHHELKKDYPDYFNFKNSENSLTLESLQNMLSEKTVLLEFIIDKHDKENISMFLLSVEKNKSNVIKIQLSSDIEKKIVALNKLLKSPTLFRLDKQKKYIELSNELYNKFIAPIENQLIDKDRIVIIGDGMTHYLPFEVLLKNKEIKPYHELDYLINDFEVSYHYSANLFAQSRKREAQQTEGMLAFAPVFSDELSLTYAPETTRRSEYDSLSTTYRAIDAVGNFVPLIYSLEEVETITKMVKNKNNQKADVLLFNQANESNLKSKLEQPYRFVHIASHSFANLRESKFSGIACAPPMDSTTTDDGTLYVGEVYNLDIPADLVVLSSCESGLGKLQAGEGLIGLNRSFIYSGVPNVVFSLWKVNDKVSSELMIEFYREVLDGEDYAGALRKAKLKLLKDETTASPNLWSSFLLIGR